MEDITLKALMNAVNALSEKLDAYKRPLPLPYSSEQIDALTAALSKAHTEMPIAGLNSDNPFFKSKYADLAEIVRVSRPSLSKNGLVVTQIPLDFDDGSWLISRLQHVSGQWIESRVRIKPPKGDIQSYASILSYLKRYAYSALTGVVSGDEDDDAEMAVAPAREVFAKGTALNTKYNPKENNSEVITREQLDELEYELGSEGDYDDVVDKILETFKIRNLADMPKSKYRASIDKLRQIKAARAGLNK
jgi:hypothetical protein